MKIRKVLPMVVLGAMLCVPSNNKRVVQKSLPKIVQEVKPKIENDPLFNQILKDTFSLHLSDERKIIEYNKLLKKYNKPTSNYIIIDKNKCQSTVYNPDGKKLLSQEILLGREFGDKRSGGLYQKNVRKSFTTTPGEYYINREGSKKGSNIEALYGQRLLYIAGDHTLQASKGYSTLALHQVPKSKWGYPRLKCYNNNNLSDNRISYGCINFLKESFDTLRLKIKGIGTRVYILPEEDKNNLYLEKQKNGTYKFFQRKYRYESQEHNNDSINIQG